MKKFLIIQTAFIGDVILATALVEQLNHQFPEGDIHFLVRKGNERILENNPHIKRVFIWDKKANKYSSYFSILIQIRKQEYSHVVNIHRFFSSGFLTVFSNATETVGFAKNPLSLFFTKKINHIFGTKENPFHEVERNAKLIEHITDNQWFKPKTYPSKSDYLKTTTKEKYITISPGSVWFTKQWPAEKWVSFIDRVGEGFTIYLLGGGNEKALCEKIKSASAHSGINVKAGQLSFLESAALMAGATMNFVNDSAPLHLASSVNAPVTAVFCSTIPAFGFSPISDNSIVLETQENLDCRPCGLHGKKACPKGHFNCSNIQIDRLLDRLG